MFLDRVRFLPNYGVDMHVVKVLSSTIFIEIAVKPFFFQKNEHIILF